MPLDLHNFSNVKIYASDLDMPFFAPENMQLYSCVRTESTQRLFKLCRELAGHFVFLDRSPLGLY